MSRTTYPLLAQLLLLTGMLLLGWVLAVLLSQALLSAGADPEAHSTLLLTQALSQTAVFLLPSILFTRYVQEPSRPILRRADRQTWVFLAAGIVAALLLIPAVDMLTEWNAGWHWGTPFAEIEARWRQHSAQVAQTTEKLLLIDGGVDLAATLLVVAILPALCEELFFRGILQQRLAHHWEQHRRPRWMQDHLAVWTVALLFSLFHGDPFALMPRWLLGALLGYLYRFSGNLIVNTGVHCLNNTLIVLIAYLHQQGVTSLTPQTGLHLPWVATLLCTTAAAATMATMAAVARRHTH